MKVKSKESLRTSLKAILGMAQLNAYEAEADSDEQGKWEQVSRLCCEALDLPMPVKANPTTEA